jgi:hypothetical protein
VCLEDQGRDAGVNFMELTYSLWLMIAMGDLLCLGL